MDGEGGGKKYLATAYELPFPPFFSATVFRGFRGKRKGKREEEGGGGRKPHFFRFYECKQNGGSRGKSGGSTERRKLAKIEVREGGMLPA